MSIETRGLIIYDVDGTILAPDELFFRAYHHTLSNGGVKQIDEVKLRSLVHAPHPYDVYNFFALEADKQMIDALRRQFITEHYQDFDLIQRGTKASLRRMIDHGWKLAALSNREVAVSETLSHAGVAEYMSIIVDGATAPKPKPEPEGVSMIMDMLGETSTKTILVGNSMEDMLAAYGAGLAFFGIGSTRTRRRFEAMGGFATPTLVKANHLIERIFP